MDKETGGGISEQLVHLKHENELLKEELLAQGEQLNREILDRKAEVDRLKIEIETLKKLLDQIQPGFISDYVKLYKEECLKYDPELERPAS